MPSYKIETFPTGPPTVRSDRNPAPNWEGKEFFPICREKEFSSDDDAISYGKHHVVPEGTRFKVLIWKDDKWVRIKNSDPKLSEGTFHGKM